ncbi:MAG: hypothetical protein SGI89_15555 [bacterium]|nr:hypothetical protein [bacterium]
MTRLGGTRLQENRLHNKSYSQKQSSCRRVRESLNRNPNIYFALSFPTACIFNITKSETHFLQASSGISESKPKHLFRLVIPDRLHFQYYKVRNTLLSGEFGNL